MVTLFYNFLIVERLLYHVKLTCNGFLIDIVDVVKRMVEAHRGRLNISNRKSGGARVEVRLPVDPGEEK